MGEVLDEEMHDPAHEQCEPDSDSEKVQRQVRAEAPSQDLNP